MLCLFSGGGSGAMYTYNMSRLLLGQHTDMIVCLMLSFLPDLAFGVIVLESNEVLSPTSGYSLCESRGVEMFIPDNVTHLNDVITSSHISTQKIWLGGTTNQTIPNIQDFKQVEAFTANCE